MAAALFQSYQRTQRISIEVPVVRLFIQRQEHNAFVNRISEQTIPAAINIRKTIKFPSSRENGRCHNCCGYINQRAGMECRLGRRMSHTSSREEVACNGNVFLRFNFGSTAAFGIPRRTEGGGLFDPGGSTTFGLWVSEPDSCV